MITKQSVAPLAIAVAMSGFGFLSQQPAIIGAGAGLAGGVGSVNLVRSRRNDRDLLDLVKQVTDFDRGLLTVNKNLTALIDRERVRDIQIETLTTELTAIGTITDRLDNQIKTQTTQISLQTQSIDRATIVAKEREIGADRAKIAELNDLLIDRPTSAPSPTIPTTHLLIDGNAMRFIRAEIGKVIDYQALRDVLTQGADRVSCKFYLGDAKNKAQQQFITYLEKNGFEVFLFPIINTEGGQQKTKGDDVQIAIDAVNVAPGDRVILCGGGDADFFPVVNRLKAKGIDFTVVAYLKTTGKALKRAAGKNIVDLADILNTQG
jgi:uncharacterized LabA/DUF88 family protein